MLALLLRAVQGQPDPSPDFGTRPGPFIALMVAGFLIGIAGHVIKSKATVATGVGLIFLGTFLLPLITHALKS